MAMFTMCLLVVHLHQRKTMTYWSCFFNSFKVLIFMGLKVGTQPAKHKVLTVLPSSANVNECQATLIHVVTE